MSYYHHNATREGHTPRQIVMPLSTEDQAVLHDAPTGGNSGLGQKQYPQFEGWIKQGDFRHPASQLLHSIPPRAPSRSSRSGILSYTLHLGTHARLSTYHDNAHGQGYLLKVAETLSPADPLVDRARQKRAGKGEKINKSGDSAGSGYAHASRSSLVHPRDPEDTSYQDKKPRINRDSSSPSPAPRHTYLNPEVLESEIHAHGYYKLGLALMKSSTAPTPGNSLLPTLETPPLPPSVHLRLAYASLTEDLLAFPGTAIQPTAHTSVDDALQPFRAVSSVCVLPGAAPPQSEASRGHIATSVAQSLINMKFGLTGASGDRSTAHEPPSFAPREPSTTSDSARRASASTSLRSADVPHVDYRIVHGRNMITRAKGIYSHAITNCAWCRRHRVSSCVVCADAPIPSLPPPAFMDATDYSTGLSRTPEAVNRIGDGLCARAAGRRPLIAVLPAFLQLSAQLLKTARERLATAPRRAPPSAPLWDFDATLLEGLDRDDLDAIDFEMALQDVFEAPAPAPATPVPILQPTPAWYALLHSMVIQACLEGYLVDGWSGIGAIEVLFGLGCGVWGRPAERASERSDGAADSREGRGADRREGARIERRESLKVSEGGSADSPASPLTTSARVLFSAKEATQAEFEKMMRDSFIEFVDIPEDTSLEEHLAWLNAKHPLSEFESAAVTFLESIGQFLGKPRLATASLKKEDARDFSANMLALSNYFQYPAAEHDDVQGPHVDESAASTSNSSRASSVKL